MACTVKVTNISSKASIKEIEEFFSYSGQIDSINLNSDAEDSQIAYVTFKDHESVKIALLLSGSVILDKEVNVALFSKSRPEELSLEPGDDPLEAGGTSPIQNKPGAINRAQDIVKAMLSRGFSVGKDAMSRANSLDEKSKKSINGDALKSMNESSNQKSKESNVDEDVSNDNNEELKGTTNEGNNLGSANKDGNDKDVTSNEEVPQVLFGSKQSKGASSNVRESMQKCYKHVCAMNEKLQLGQRTMSALASAQQGVATAGSVVANNRFVAAGGVWVSGALSRVSLKSSPAPHDGEGTPQHQEHVQLTEMTSFSSHKSEHD